VTLLPPNATTLERAVETSMARLLDVPVPLRSLWNPDTCPVELLPYLAWALSIDSWSSAWPEAIKRARVRQALAIQRRKGTSSSVRDVVESFGGSVALREWWQMTPPGDPHTFNLLLNINDASGAPVDAAFVDAVIAEVYRTKPVRSHFTFSQALGATAGIVPVGAVRPAVFARLTMTAPAA
jgi:phage tail P2-like protein